MTQFFFFLINGFSCVHNSASRSFYCLISNLTWTNYSKPTSALPAHRWPSDQRMDDWSVFWSLWIPLCWSHLQNQNQHVKPHQPHPVSMGLLLLQTLPMLVEWLFPSRAWMPADRQWMYCFPVIILHIRSGNQIAKKCIHNHKSCEGSCTPSW